METLEQSVDKVIDLSEDDMTDKEIAFLFGDEPKIKDVVVKVDQGLENISTLTMLKTLFRRHHRIILIILAVSGWGLILIVGLK